MDTIKPTEITFDPAKNAANVRERGLPFSLVKDAFDWAGARVVEDRRRDYGEPRYRAHVSLRKANRREERGYAKKTESETD